MSSRLKTMAGILATCAILLSCGWSAALAEERTTKEPSPGFDTLKPGESRRVIHDDSVEIRDTLNDRLTFANGASIEERRLRVTVLTGSW